MWIPRMILASIAMLATAVVNGQLPEDMRSQDGTPRYWAWAYESFAGPESYERALVMCHELKQWGTTDLVFETPQGAVPWPTAVKCCFTDTARSPAGDFDYNRKHDRIDALCRAARKYGIKIWFSFMARDGGALGGLGKYGWENKGGPEFARRIIKERLDAGFYAKDKKGNLMKYGAEPGNIYFDLVGDAYLRHMKDLISELREKYGHYDTIAGIVLDEIELTMVADSLEDDLPAFSAFCERNFGEKYTGKSMPQLSGMKAADVWWRREMLFRRHVLNRFFEEITAHAHQLGLKTIKPNRSLESYNDWPWRCGMDIKDYSRIFDYVWIASATKSQLDPYLNYDNLMVATGMAYGDLASRFAECFHGKPLSDHAYPCGTTTNYLPFYTDVERKLFMGHQNNKNWFNLFNSWTGGVSPAKTAVVINSFPFAMQHPDTLDKYNELVAPLFERLSEVVDVDGLQFTQLDKLGKYPALIVPEGTPVAMSGDECSAYLRYVNEGGVIISLNAQWSTGREDMTDMRDVTEELTGCAVGEPVESEGKIIAKLPWLPSVAMGKTILRGVVAKSAETIAVDGDGHPVVCERKLGKGKVISVWFPVVRNLSSGSAAAKALLSAILARQTALPVTAEGNAQIVQTVLKDGKIAVAVKKFGDDNKYKNTKKAMEKLGINEKEALALGVDLKLSAQPAETVLKINAGELGIKGKELEGKLGTGGRPLFSVKDIVSGRVMESPYRDKSVRDLNRYDCSWTAEELQKGIPVKLRFGGEFAVVAVSEYEGLERFAGVMPCVTWEEDQSTAGDLLTPTEEELGISKKTTGKPGMRVGVFAPIKELITETYGAKEIFAALSETDGIAPVMVDDISAEKLRSGKIEVLVYCQSAFKEEEWIKKLMGKRTDALREWVKDGGGLLAEHDVSGYRRYPVIFPDVCGGGVSHSWGVEGPDAKKCVIAKAHPLSDGFQLGEEFSHGYDDHVCLQPGRGGEVIVVDKLAGKPTLVAGKVGKGRYVAAGTCSADGKLSGKEKALLVNCVRWLAGK